MPLCRVNSEARHEFIRAYLDPSSSGYNQQGEAANCRGLTLPCIQRIRNFCIGATFMAFAALGMGCATAPDVRWSPISADLIVLKYEDRLRRLDSDVDSCRRLSAQQAATQEAGSVVERVVPFIGSAQRQKAARSLLPDCMRERGWVLAPVGSQPKQAAP
jgi:hypothetical protein